MVLLDICNAIAILFYIAAIPGYYILGYHPLMQAIFVSSGIYLLFCLLQFLFYKRLRLLLIALAIFIFHALSNV